MRLLVAIVIHVLFLLSIFYIHFRSPILQGLPDGAEHNEPPADRLILFVGDGLRAESFLKGNLERTPFLRRTLLNQGLFGVSNTRVPTESRPGHAALLAGVYEDPSAVFRGWKENPVEFDSVLNRSSVSYCWGSPDIVNMFSRGATEGRVRTATYDSDDELFTQSANTSLLDIWVFNRVRQFLVSEEASTGLLRRKKVVLFLHLLGLDTAGHVHKPHSELFTENLITVDKGIESIVQMIEKATGSDGRTAYIFTSDHGMTDHGSHGSGHPLETETPFLAWGAGFSHWKTSNLRQLDDERTVLELDGNRIPVHQINQADIAPLMSAVLGISVPKNSFGRLPRILLNVSEEYATWALRNNADQLLQQYYRWQTETEGKMLQWLTTGKQMNLKNSINRLLTKIKDASDARQYVEVQNLTETLMDVTIEAIQYFQSYYKPHLFFALTTTMLGWLLILAKETFTVPSKNSPTTGRRSGARAIFMTIIITATVLCFNVAQHTPPIIILYFLVPVVMWGTIAGQWCDYKPLFNRKTCGHVTRFIFAVEVLVLSFLHRVILLPLLWIHSLLLMKPLFAKKSMTLRWISVNLLLSVFLLIPIVIAENKYLLYISVFLWTIANGVIVKLSSDSLNFKWVKLCAHLLQSANLLFLISSIEAGQPVPKLNRIMCWVFSAFGVASPFFASTTSAERMLAIFSGLSGPYMMLSLSYEPLFLLCFCCTVYNWMHVERLQSQQWKTRDLSIESTTKPSGVEDVHRVLAFMLLLLSSFFGTGNLATISSFDPNSVRCFVSTFSPFTMMGLIVFKLLIPVLIVVCALRAILTLHAIPKGKTFTLMLIVCDGMCMNFFFLVRNEGSWMEIGTSISHFVILECTTIVVMVLYELARFYLEFTLGTGTSRHKRTPATLNPDLPFTFKERVE